MEVNCFHQGVIQVAEPNLLIALNLLLSHLVVLDFKVLVSSYRGLEVDMMQLCPYLQSQYFCLYRYLCPLIHLLLEFWVHNVLAFWQRNIRIHDMVLVLLIYSCKFHANKMSKQMLLGFINVSYVEKSIFKIY